MKRLVLAATVLLSFTAFAEEEKPLSVKLEEKKYYYSALNEFFKEAYVREVTKDDLAKLEDPLFYTGIELLEDYDPSMLTRFPTSSTRFILGRREMKLNHPKKALEYFDKIQILGSSIPRNSNFKNLHLNKGCRFYFLTIFVRT